MLSSRVIRSLIKLYCANRCKLNSLNESLARENTRTHRVCSRTLGASIICNCKPPLQDDQEGYLRELDASDILAIHGESSGHVYLYRVHKLIRISHRWFEVMCCLCYRVTRMVT